MKRRMPAAIASGNTSSAWESTRFKSVNHFSASLSMGCESARMAAKDSSEAGSTGCHWAARPNPRLNMAGTLMTGYGSRRSGSGMALSSVRNRVLWP